MRILFWTVPALVSPPRSSCSLHIVLTCRHAAALQEDSSSDRTLFALRNPVTSPVEDNAVTVSFNSGPNPVVQYDYTVACYARNENLPTTDCGAVEAAGIAPIVPPVTGTLPSGYAEVNVEFSLPYLNPVVDCLVTVSGGVPTGPVDEVTKCQYAPPSGTAAPSTLLVVNVESTEITACSVRGTSVFDCYVVEVSGEPLPSLAYAIAIRGDTAYLSVPFANGVYACAIERDDAGVVSLRDCVLNMDTSVGEYFYIPITMAIGGNTLFATNLGGFINGGLITRCSIGEGTSMEDCAFVTIDDVPFLDGGVPLEIVEPFAIGISGDTLYVASSADGSITACDSTWPCRTNESIGLVDPVAMAISGTDGALDRRSP